MSVLTPNSVGELYDKISILQIKCHKITGEKAKHCQNELFMLTQIVEELQTTCPDWLFRDLKNVNETLWEIEDEIRICEKNKDFGQDFIDYARAVYYTNDERASIKRRINDLNNSEIVEVKSYQKYN